MICSSLDQNVAGTEQSLTVFEYHVYLAFDYDDIIHRVGLVHKRVRGGLIACEGLGTGFPKRRESIMSIQFIKIFGIRRKLNDPEDIANCRRFQFHRTAWIGVFLIVRRKAIDKPRIVHNEIAMKHGDAHFARRVRDKG